MSVPPVLKGLSHESRFFFSQIATRLQQTMYNIGEATIQLIKDGADVQGSPDQQYLKRALADQARIVTEKVRCSSCDVKSKNSKKKWLCK